MEEESEKKWEILSETDVSPSPWFPIVQHKVKLPDGSVVDDYFITNMPDAVMVVPILEENGHMVLVKQYKHGQQRSLIELPAGFVQKDKSIIASALAEWNEETGILATDSDLISLGKVSNIPTKATQCTHGFLATGLKFNSIQDLDTTEDITVLTHSPLDVIEMISNGELWVADSVSFIMKAYLKYPGLFI